MDDQLDVEDLQPRDLQTRNHEAYLIAEQGDGQLVALPLDCIRNIDSIEP
jgi:hypothetical protein